MHRTGKIYLLKKSQNMKKIRICQKEEKYDEKILLLTKISGSCSE